MLRSLEGDVPGVTTVLLDADGNLFPSEEPAFDAAAEVLNRLLAELGLGCRVQGPELRRKALGKNFRSIATDVANEAGVELGEEALRHWVDREIEAVTDHLRSRLRPDHRVLDPLRSLRRNYRLAVVSSSALTRLDACLEATGLAELLPEETRFSAHDSLPQPSSKPDPAVYQHALAELGVDMRQAVAVEDAVTGVVSARGAGVTVVGNLLFVPAEERTERARDLRDAGAAAVFEDWSGFASLLGRQPDADRSVPW